MEAKQLDLVIVNSLRPLFELISGNPWIQSAIVILITIICASLLTWLIFRVIGAITSRTSLVLDDQIVKLLRPPIYYTLVVIGVTAGIGLMPIETWKIYLIRTINSIGIIIWVFFFTSLASLLLQRLAGLSDKFKFIQYRTVTLFDNLAKIIIFGAGVYGFFVVWNIDMTAWLASAGIVGIAVGFAAKDTLANLFSGVFILADAPYKVGDFVVLDGGLRGQVQEIGIRSTRVLTRDDVEVTVPNAVIANARIVNETGGPSDKMRVRVKVSAAYGSDVDQVRDVLLGCTDGAEFLASTPAPRVRFRAFGDSGLEFELLAWIEEPLYRGRVIDELNRRVYKAFAAAGIEIPYAKQDVYVKELPRRVGDA